MDLRLEQAALQYDTSPVAAVEPLDLTVGPSSTLGIVGESGSGKTSVARMLGGLVSPTSGEALVDGQPWALVSRRSRQRRSVQMIFQDPYASLNPRLTIMQTVAEPVVTWQRVSKGQATRVAAGLLEAVGMPQELWGRRPGQLSGGQCQRIGIARALACDPAVLIADEPTSALDVSVQAQVLNLLLSLRRERGLTLVLVSHDLSVVRHLTDEALVMFRGRVVERGSTSRLLSQPQHPYTAVLASSLPESKRRMSYARNQVARDHWCNFASLCPALRKDCGTAGPAARERSNVLCAHPNDFMEKAADGAY